MKKYKILQIPIADTELEEKINKLAEEGWIVKSTIKFGYYLIIFLERESTPSSRNTEEW